MVATTDQKAMLLDLSTTVMELVRDGKRDINEVLSVLQRIKDDPLFATNLPGASQGAKIDSAAKIVVVKHIIDCDANPFLLQGWQVEEHRKGGQFKWNPSKVALYLSENQQNGKLIKGGKLHHELANQSVFNANVLDYLLANPELIPEEWKGKTVFFWGTIYRDAFSNLCVRCLYWHGKRWIWHFRWLGSGWGVSDPAAVRASS